MDAPETTSSAKEEVAAAEVEPMLEQALAPANHLSRPPEEESQLEGAIQPYDFRHPVFLSPNELRKLRVQHEAIVSALAARLSIYLRLEFGLRMVQLQPLTYRKFVQSLSTPCHLTLFKVEPLRGICILDVNPRLGLTIVDRLMGGSGQAVSAQRDLSEIEVALLDQAVQLLIVEWANHWSGLEELTPVLLGHENTGRFLQTSQPDAVMVAVSLEAHMGDCVEQIQIGFPYATLEPLLRSLSAKLSPPSEESGGVVTAVKPKWKTQFDDIKVPVVADWTGLRMSARDLAKLKIGDVVPLPNEFSTEVRLCLAKVAKFRGRIGTSEGRWAVELTEILRT